MAGEGLRLFVCPNPLEILMLDILNQIELAANELAELNYQLQLDRDALTAIEAEISLQILDARNDVGKPLYSNETARANALTLQVRQHTDYQFRLTNIRATEQERARLQAALERLRGLFKIELLERQEAIYRVRQSADLVSVR
jgi:hypothetical protein